MPERRRAQTLYFESRYRKLLRGLPQTIFYCPDCKGDRRRRVGCARCEGRGKLTEDSVQEIIGRAVLPRLRARTGRFHGAGREDVDVLMLGRGRPFVYEVVAPRQSCDLAELEELIAQRAQGRIELAPLAWVGRDRVVFWKQAQFAKVYRARVRTAGPVAGDPAELAGRAVQVQQRTPERVAHRRADLVREREVEIRGVDLVDERAFDVEVRCSHGTYVKEWISGEDGRTTPSLAELVGCGATCEQLDVLEVLYEEGVQAAGEGQG